jgi:hypothetical protein
LASTQYNRASPGKLEGARGSMSVEQVASNYLSLEFLSPADRENQNPIQHRNLKCKKSRDGDSFVIQYEFDFNKTTIKELATKEEEPEFEDNEYLTEM